MKEEEPKGRIANPYDYELGLRTSAPYKGEGGTELAETDLAARIEKAREEYFNMYESDPVTWGALNDNERFNHLVERLEDKEIKFSPSELISLKVSLLATRARRKDRP